MNYVLKPSLEHIALTKIAVTLWNQDDVRTLTTRVRFFPLNSVPIRIPCRWIKVDLNAKRNIQAAWKVIEDKVTENVPKLPLPETLKIKLLHFIYAIGYEILNWRRYHEKNFFLGTELPNEICWTPHGMVDKKKTAKALIKNGELGSFDRYRIACAYCLEDDIPELWEKITEYDRSLFYRKDSKVVHEHDLVAFWTYDVKGETAKIYSFITGYLSPYNTAFQGMAACDGNKPATEHFLQKITHTEREESLVTCAKIVADRRFRCLRSELRCFEFIPKEYFSHVLCFLLSQMDEDQQIEVFKSHGSQVLGCFLDWPRQSHFMEMADRMWDFLSEEGFSFVLREIVYKVKGGFKDCDYQTLFGNFWLESPNTHKRYVIGQWVASREHLILLRALFQFEDIENIRLILKSATVKEREDIIFSNKGKDICERLACRNKLNSLKFFVQECILSREVMIKFKQEFQEHVVKPRLTFKGYFMSGAGRKNECGKFFPLLDDLIREKKKRSREEGESSAVKRIHSAEFEGVTRTTKK